MENQSCKILFVGESAYKIHVHFKGFASYETAYLGDNLEPFTKPVEKEGVQVQFMRNHDVSVKFPLSMEELLKYDAVVISDAPSDSFLLHPQTLNGERLPNRFKLINEYVRNGGGFVMIGGWMAFSGFHAKARYCMTSLTEILPVKICTYDDRMEVPEGVIPEVLAPGHPVLEGISGEWPFFLGYNKTFYDRGQTLMTIGADPLLVVDQVGKGRVAVFTSDVLPHWGPKEFVGWDYYGRFWAQLFKWVAGKI
jgi:uncharacterized membrane protein